MMQFKEELGRFYREDDQGNLIGEVTYTSAGEGIYILDHTYVNAQYRGQGIAEKLVDAVVQKAIAENKKIIPLCPYAKALFAKTPAYQKVEK